VTLDAAERSELLEMMRTEKWPRPSRGTGMTGMGGAVVAHLQRQRREALLQAGTDSALRSVTAGFLRKG